MRNDEYIKIDGITLPTPDRCGVTEYDIDAATTGRPESGYMHRDRVRASVMRLDAEWTDLSPDDAILIRNLIEPAQFSVEIKRFGETDLRTMYAGDRKWNERYDSAGMPHISLTVAMSEY